MAYLSTLISFEMGLALLAASGLMRAAHPNYSGQRRLVLTQLFGALQRSHTPITAAGSDESPCRGEQQALIKHWGVGTKAGGEGFDSVTLANPLHCLSSE